MSRSIIVLPHNTAKLILEAIAQAKQSIRIKMFIFSDPSIIASQNRGIDARIMFNPSDRTARKKTRIHKNPYEYWCQGDRQRFRF